MVKLLVRSSGLVGLALALLAIPAARAAETEPGVLWESTFSMKTKQFSMPPTTTQFCAPKEGLNEPPRGKNEDKNCKVTDVKKSGNKMTWKMICTGEHPMTGEGEITQGKDKYDGKMAMHSAEMGDVEATMAGKKLGGECDAGKVKKDMAAMKAQQDGYLAQQAEAQGKACDKAAAEMQVQIFTMPGSFCKEQAQIDKLCARVPTREGFLALAKHGSDQVASAGKLCKVDVVATKAKLCKGAAADAKAGGSAPPADALEFLPPNCPDETNVLAKKECAGRSYTGMPGTWRGFCVAAAKQGLTEGEGSAKPPSTGAGDDDSAESVQDKAIKKAKKGLKGLFGG